MSVILAISTLSLAFFSVPQAPPVPSDQMNRLIDVFLKKGGQLGYQALLLLSQRPEIAKVVIDSRIKSTADEKVKERLRALRERILLEALKRIIDERSKTGLIYSGQWKDLKQYDPEIGKLLLSLAKHPFENPQIRQSALHALGDLKIKEAIPELRRLTEDILQPDYVIEAAGLALADLGDSSWVEKRIDRLQGIASSSTADVAQKYAALKQLANYYYRLGKYKEAISVYERTVKVIEARLQTISGEEALVLRDTLRLHYYNAACSASKLGDIDSAEKFLNKSLANAVDKQTIRELFRSIQEDGDLQNFRKDKRYKAFLEKLKTLIFSKPL